MEEYTEQQTQEEQPNRKKNTKKNLVSTIILVVAIVAAYFVFGRTDVMPGVKVEFEGIDGSGTATAKIIGKKIGVDRKASRSLNKDTKFIFSDSKDLSNGDEIYVEVKPNILWYKGGTKEVTVEDLISKEEAEKAEIKSLTKAEIEENVQLTYSGEDESGTAVITNNFTGPLEKLQFKLDKASNLTNGDSINLQLTQADKEFIEEYNYELEGLPTYTVSGLREKEVVAEVPANIRSVTNYRELQNKIEERKYKDYVEYEAGDQYTFDVEYDFTVYRQYSVDDPGVEPQHRNGLLINVYTITQYEGRNKNKYVGKYYSLLGVGNIYADENGKVDMVHISEFKETVANGCTEAALYESLKSNGLYKIN